MKSFFKIPELWITIIFNWNYFYNKILLEEFFPRLVSFILKMNFHVLFSLPFLVFKEKERVSGRKVKKFQIKSRVTAKFRFDPRRFPNVILFLSEGNRVYFIRSISSCNFSYFHRSITIILKFVEKDRNLPLFGDLVKKFLDSPSLMVYPEMNIVFQLYIRFCNSVKNVNSRIRHGIIDDAKG